MNELAIRDSETRTQTQRIDVSLTKEIANAFVERIEKEGIVAENWREITHIELYLRDEEGDIIPFPKLISKATYNAWITRRNRVPETGELFCSMLDKARETFELNKEKKERKEMIAIAKKGLAELQKLPTMKDGKTIKRTTGFVGKSVRDLVEITEEHGTFIESNRLKLDGYKFLLERLDPDFMPKQHDRMDVAILTLADLRRYKREQDGEI